MFTPNTYPLEETTFVDTFGFFAFRLENQFEMIVPNYFTHGKLGKYRGKAVKLTRIAKKHYGNIIEIEQIKSVQISESRLLKLSDFIEASAPYYSIKKFSSEKVSEGYKLFDFLRKYNPIYFQKNKDWKNQFIESSKIGDYFVLKENKENRVLRILNNEVCIVIATYNKGYKNGFMAIALEE
jgi:hypothetical protein